MCPKGGYISEGKVRKIVEFPIDWKNFKRWLDGKVETTELEAVVFEEWIRHDGKVLNLTKANFYGVNSQTHAIQYECLYG